MNNSDLVALLEDALAVSVTTRWTVGEKPQQSTAPCSPAARRRKGMGKLKCICRGNWRLIIAETEQFIGKQYFERRSGNEFTFFGIVHGGDDYYYGMYGKSGLRLLSCVGSIDGHGFELIRAKGKP